MAPDVPLNPVPLPARLRVARTIGHARWLRQGLRARAIRALLGAPPVAPVPVTFDWAGGVLTGDLRDWIDFSLFFYGEYEPEVQGLLAALAAAGRNGTFVDIGANRGLHTLFAARHYSRVHAFEPFPPMAARLRANVAAWGATNVAIHEVGLGEADERRLFYAPPGDNLGTGSFEPAHSARNTAFQPFEVRAGDSYVAARVGKIDVIKLDVEGFEPEVLRGLAGTLAASRPAVILELSETAWEKVGGAAGFRRLLPDGYLWADIEARAVVMGFFERPQLRLRRVRELRPGCNVLALPPESWPVRRTACLED